MGKNSWTEADLFKIGKDRNGNSLPKEGAKLFIPAPMGIWIPGNVPSQKNSKRIGKRKDGTPFVMNSELVLKYKKEVLPVYREKIHDWKRMASQLTPPYRVVMKFVRKDKRGFDYNNISQMVQDCMADAGWVEDDDNKNILPIFLDAIVDKENAGVFIMI
ncbi:MAG: hypothetical protein F6K19_01615 [Cyanothece sp. SIO1E1]|nr:hypothetical protein [Cyanothece sp. SIO1E1]